MAEIYAVINQKGGVAKSTTAQILGNAIRHKGHSVLFIDLDPQGNLTYGMGIDTPDAGIYEVLTKRKRALDAVTTAKQGDILASTPNLTLIEHELQNELDKEYRLKEALDTLGARYDYIIIDTPPSLSTLSINALTSANKVIIPTQADIYSIQGLAQLSQTIETVRKYTNDALEVAGILITRYDKRTILTQQLTEMLENTARMINTKVFDAKIREAIAVKEAQAMRDDLLTYAPKANVTADYLAFIDELGIK
ncbi:ParA family protein [Facklamia sp. P12937]|uniref:ParA family protein n=1 Tax=Facklamia sp. P12937 TaxID=3421949 RepID=UPI003D186997